MSITGRPKAGHKKKHFFTCTKCKHEKIGHDFYWQKLKDVKGETYFMPQSLCKECIKQMRRDDIVRRGKEINALRKIRYARRAPILRKRTSDWQKQNPEKMAAIKRVRYERLKAASDAPISIKRQRQWLLDAIQRQCQHCYYCGQQLPLESDHKIPVCRGGKNVPENIVASCRPCNAMKGTQTAQEFLSP